MDKKVSASEAISQIESGMTIGIGGWGIRRKPMSLVRELLKAGKENFTVVSYGGPDVGMLCASGKIKKLIFGFVSLETTPLEPHFRKTRQEGKIEIMEIDEGMLNLGLGAAGMRLPFSVTRVGLGTDVLTLNPEIKTIKSPYSDEILVAMPAIPLDIALIHVHEADVVGNTFIYGPYYFFDEQFARAASKVVVSTEKIIKTEEITIEKSLSNRFERSLVTSVVEAEFGAHPTAATPNYGFDKLHLEKYSQTVDEKSWQDYFGTFIDIEHKRYVEAVGGKQFISSLEAPVF